MEKKIKSKIEIKLTEGERDLLYFYLLGVYSLEDIETFEEYPAVVDKLEESITEVAKSTRRRSGVESKLEKLERVKPMSLMGMMGEVAPQWVAKELNKIIDHLNSQDQEEEDNTKLVMPPSAYEQAEKEGFDMSNKVKSELIPQDTPEEKKTLVQLRRVFDKKRVKEWDRTAMETYKQATQDTPEQKEEWEEEFMEVLETFKDEICSNFFASSKPLTDFIKQLLLEREREAEKNLLKRFYNATSKEEFRDMLDKLLSKKK